LVIILRRNQDFIITVKCKHSKKNEMRGKGMQEFPKMIKKKGGGGKRSFPKCWEYIALLGTLYIIPEGKKKADIGCKRNKLHYSTEDIRIRKEKIQVSIESGGMSLLNGKGLTRNKM
jgi:hypothetical protein